jgi:hypothetical protein
MRASPSFAAIAVLALTLAPRWAASRPPELRHLGGAAQLSVDGRPLFMLGGELGNSAAGTATQAELILPRLAAEHFNTVLMPVAWDEIEPEEGHFDFAVLDHGIAAARRETRRCDRLAEIYIVGSGLTVAFLRDPDVDDRIAGIAEIDELTWKAGRWTIAERLNGDQSNQGHGLLMDAHLIHLYRVRLYSYPRR